MSLRRIRRIYRISTGAVIVCLCCPNARVRYLASLLVLLGAGPLFRAIHQSIEAEATRYGAREALKRYCQARQAADVHTQSTDRICAASEADARLAAPDPADVERAHPDDV